MAIVARVITEDEARAILGVGPSAGAEQVRRAYRRLARQYHPDAGGDADAFHVLQEAVARLVEQPAQEPPPQSPPRSNVRRPSTEGRMGAAGWGEATDPRWHEGTVALDEVDWDRPLPDPPHAWSRDLVAVAAARDLVDSPVHPLAGVSRRPGSRLNRFAAWLSSDLLAGWVIGPSRDAGRGRAGHDVEVRLELPSGKARRLAEEAAWPVWWTRERRPSSTIATRVLTPSRSRRATALRSADTLAEGLDLLGWPLTQWWHVPQER